MTPKRTSAVWNFFAYVDNDLALCKVCNKMYSRKGRTTSSLKRHLRSAHHDEYLQCLKLEADQPSEAYTSHYSMSWSSQSDMVEVENPPELTKELSTESLENELSAYSPQMMQPIKVERRRSSSVSQEDSQDEMLVSVNTLQDFDGNISNKVAKTDPLTEPQSSRIKNKNIHSTRTSKSAKRSLSPSSCHDERPIYVNTSMSSAKELSEFEVTGLSVANKLAKMNPIQAIYAESIINNVLRQGLLNKLNEDTDLCDNRCNGRKSSSVQVVSSGHIL